MLAQSATDTAPAQATRTATPRSRFYHPELDGLRFLAFLLVFFHHAVPITPTTLRTPIADAIFQWVYAFQQAGMAGVDLFFVLSSYLLTELLLREKESKGSIAVGAFYIRRTLRIWPLYFAYLAFAIWVEPLFRSTSELSPEYAIAFATFVGNWSLCWHDALPTSSAVVLWSVSIEEQFYLVWPWIVRWSDRRRILLLAACAIVAAIVVRALLIANDRSYISMYFNTFARLEGIGWGAILAAVLHGRELRLATSARRLLQAGGLLLIVVSTRYLPSDIWGGLEWRMLPKCSFWSIGSVLIFLGTLRPLGTKGGLLASRPLVFLGRISYGLYVVHNLVCLYVIENKQTWFPDFGFFTLNTAIVLVSLSLTIAMATASYYLLEAPFLRLKLRFTHVASRPGG